MISEYDEQQNRVTALCALDDAIEGEMEHT
jgi:hypothetical protein